MNKELAQVGDFCTNPDCPDYGILQRDQPVNKIIKFGKSRAGHQRFRCQTCKETFVETKGTMFYGRRTSDEAIIRVLLMIAEGSCISSVSRQTGHKEDTISDWLKAAAQHVDEIESVLMKEYKVNRAQIDGLWLYVKNKGVKKTLLKPRPPASFGDQPL